ncbi:Pkinase-domain-containing protein [Westerdykella ornata]|uniref:non-specific serine/threonine protein kinase n=1 Tax=Westerdykella ornata TaxID=318751 RepID=A0A6A6JNW6_WESOR|nr:Pkinase-domain-containing protein [Westerdykella ornata]KAF2277843.1 Pkinase-domain-containing protein [Westerdykella ornata]
MSSAAVQQSSGPAISPRSYQPQQSSSHAQSQYYTQQSPPAASPSSSSRPSRRPSGNGASLNAPTSPHAQHSPGVAATSNPNSPRPLPNVAHPSPTMTTSAATNSFATGAPMPPPRTSSQRNTPADRIRDDGSTAAASAAQSRRKGKESPRHHGSSSRSKTSPGQPSHSRSATAIGEPAAGTTLPREESTVINRIVVADPQEDLARAEARLAEARPVTSGADVTPITGLGLVGSEGVDDGGRGAGKSRQDHPKTERRSKFGNYILGQTLGEGEFGKVKIGWKKDSSVEVAIKLIKRESLGSQSRLQKIYREIHILRGLDHPNIVRLHEMVETERHIGIILEYASGGELFDYILNHRYLKDGAARRLFAQLVSGVGYLHKKGIVHRDLKLENLLLDRNRNIIITDFGFANTFDPNDELSEEIEYNLGNKEYIKSLGLDGPDGVRRGDLMQTSCGSPCYAAPELVVSDSLYTGRKVDVWSCGVILYAMLAGYLPFDDDPANPEGDNINLLYKYIVSTPLTFPEYVTPHARDLLKRILVPDPRKRADLFEVARHSWLSEYAHVVSFITSSTATPNDIAKTTILPKEEVPTLARSASVREPTKPHSAVAPVGGLTAKREQINRNEPSEKSKSSRDNKRRTVQVEYVAPQSQTARGEASPPTAAAGSSKSRGKEQGYVEAPAADGYQAPSAPGRQGRPAAATDAATTRPTRETQRSISDYAFANVPATSAARPSTGGTLSGRLPSRGNSYGQPAVATVAQTNAEGRFSQPKGKQYHISAPMAQQEGPIGEPSIGQPSTHRVPAQPEAQPPNYKGHRRSNTVSETIGRVTSMFTGRQHADSAHSTHVPNKIQKSYPPVSMVPISQDEPPRKSQESSRRTSFGFSRKNTDQSGNKSTRRFSLLPSSLSRTFMGHRESLPPSSSHSAVDRRTSAAPAARKRTTSRPGMNYPDSRSPSQSTTRSERPGFYDGAHESGSRIRAGSSSAPAQQTQFSYSTLIGDEKFPGPTQPHPSQKPQAYRHPNDSDASQRVMRGGQQQQRPQYPAGFDSSECVPPATTPQRERPGVLQKHRKFADAYEDKGHHAGSSGSAKRVMDIFRRLGRQRTKEDR